MARKKVQEPNAVFDAEKRLLTLKGVKLFYPNIDQLKVQYEYGVLPKKELTNARGVVKKYVATFGIPKDDTATIDYIEDSLLQVCQLEGLGSSEEDKRNTSTESLSIDRNFGSISDSEGDEYRKLKGTSYGEFLCRDEGVTIPQEQAKFKGGDIVDVVLKVNIGKNTGTYHNIMAIDRIEEGEYSASASAYTNDLSDDDLLSALGISSSEVEAPAKKTPAKPRKTTAKKAKAKAEASGSLNDELGKNFLGL